MYLDWVHCCSTLHHILTGCVWILACMSSISKTSLQPFIVTQSLQLKSSVCVMCCICHAQEHRTIPVWKLLRKTQENGNQKYKMTKLPFTRGPWAVHKFFIGSPSKNGHTPIESDEYSDTLCQTDVMNW